MRRSRAGESRVGENVGGFSTKEKKIRKKHQKTKQGVIGTRRAYLPYGSGPKLIGCKGGILHEKTVQKKVRRKKSDFFVGNMKTTYKALVKTAGIDLKEGNHAPNKLQKENPRVGGVMRHRHNQTRRGGARPRSERKLLDENSSKHLSRTSSGNWEFGGKW